jgi:hypothetical protein
MNSIWQYLENNPKFNLKQTKSKTQLIWFVIQQHATPIMLCINLKFPNELLKPGKLFAKRICTIINRKFNSLGERPILHCNITRFPQEFAMSTAALAHPASYFVDVSNAARAFAAALFAAQERQFVAQEVTRAPQASPRVTAAGRRELAALANRYENLSPNLSAELRNLAARG